MRPRSLRGPVALGLAQALVLAMVPLAVANAADATAAPPATAEQVRAAQASAPEAQPAARFDLLEIRVLGNTALKPRVIEAATYPFLGYHRSIDDVQSARAALEAAYH